MAEGESTPPVFLIDSVPDGETAILEGEEARHAVTVRRIKPGELVLLSDGNGTLARSEVETVQPGKKPVLRLQILTRWHETTPALHVTVVQALVKGERGELAVELATEAGADTIVPWRAARSVARWDDPQRAEKALARWRNTARAAAKQSRRARVPIVSQPVGTEQLASRVPDTAAAFLLDAGADTSLRDTPLPAEGELLLIIGPEGGIAPDELTALTEAGARTVRIGPTVLRASTAAAVALGALGARTDRWDPPRRG